MKKILYFAYGSNLLSERLFRRIGKFSFFKNYNLENYDLTFDCQGFANIKESKGSFVEGCLYEVTSSQISELNFYEACYNVEYFDYDKNTIILVYVGKQYIVERSTALKVKPMSDYIRIIMMGAEEKGLNNLYSKLEKILETIPKPFLRSKSLKRKTKRFGK